MLIWSSTGELFIKRGGEQKGQYFTKMDWKYWKHSIKDILYKHTVFILRYKGEVSVKTT